jgi:hypothetical protein
MVWSKTIRIFSFAAFFAQGGDMTPVPVTRQTEEFALMARREGQVGPQIPIPPDLFAKVTETISVYPTICDADAARLFARLPSSLRVQSTGNACRSGPRLCLLFLGRELPLLDLPQA